MTREIYRVNRGGARPYLGKACRSTNRYSYEPDVRGYMFLGFRPSFRLKKIKR